jgi:predicted SnoaL-like aldol condensation-catalyzing enzyme
MLTKKERKNMILQWWDEYFRDGKKEVLSKYVHDDYIQHIPFLPDGPEGIHVFLEMQGGKFPTEIKRVMDDEELIAIHFQANGPPIPDRSWNRIKIAVVDFFRMKDGKFFEHWFAAEPVAPTVSGYDMFSDVLKPLTDVTQEQEKANREVVKEAFTNAFEGGIVAFSRYMSDDPYIENTAHIYLRVPGTYLRLIKSTIIHRSPRKAKYYI